MTISRNLSALAQYVASGGILGQASSLPTQTGNNGKYLTTNGTVASWGTVSVTPTAVSSQANTATDFFGLPSGTTAQRPASPANGYMRYNTTTGYAEVYNATAAQWLSFGVAPTLTVEYLIVAGGGGGGTDSDVGGGGGAGGLLNATTSVTTGQNYSITIGGGGARGTGVDSTGTGGGSNGTQGSSSAAFGITTVGGGYGGTRSNAGGAGGSGGGGGDGGAAGGAGTTGQGYAGGTAPAMNSNSGWDQGGGGGAGGAAVSFTPGPGLSNSITGSAITYAAGGTGQAGGSVSAVDGTANTGNGGHSCRAGGSGVVILKYSSAYSPSFSGGLTTSTTTSGAYKISTVTAGTGTVTFN